MFDKDNFLNSLTYYVEETLTNAIEDKKIDIPNSNIVVERKTLDISSIASQNDYYILLLFQRSSRLPYAGDTINERKKRRYRVEIFCIAQTDSLSNRLAGAVTSFVDSNQHLFASFGLRKASIPREFLRVMDSQVFNGRVLGDTFSALAGTLEGEIIL